MNLGFKKRFVKNILACFYPKRYPKQREKIHTIREDELDRWQAGKKIHFATGTRTAEYNCFYSGKKAICKSTQKINILYAHDEHVPKIEIDKRVLTYGEMCELALNDGFKNLGEFLDWFNKSFKGKIIHWTDKKY